jgi:hypothetical protein
MRRAVRNAGHRLTQYRQVRGFRFRSAMVTLTYRPGTPWEPSHVRDFLRHVRQWLKRRGHDTAYVWVAELTRAGVPHYHVVLWLPRGLTLPKPDKQGWWRHGSTRIEWARKPVGYLTKYASKGDVGPEFPKGLRLHGRGGLSPECRRIVAWWLLPRYVREVFTHLGDWVVRRPGGGWFSRDTGECIDARPLDFGLPDRPYG